MKKFILGAACLALVLVDTTQLSGFAFLTLAPFAKWGSTAIEPSSSAGNVDFWFNDAGTPDMTGGGAGAGTGTGAKTGEWTVLIGCLQDWETATAGNLDIRWAGWTTGYPVYGDGVNTVSWGEVEGSTPIPPFDTVPEAGNGSGT